MDEIRPFLGELAAALFRKLPERSGRRRRTAVEQATRLPEGVISPGGVGYARYPPGLWLPDRRGGEELLEDALGDKSVEQLAMPKWIACSRRARPGCLERGYARPEDLEHTEESGRMKDADAAFVSTRAKERGRDQLGTLGAGNHFLEVDRVAEVYDDNAARRLGLFPNQVAVQVHCGSRSLGHQVCEDFVARFQKVVRDYNIHLPDRELVCAPFSSPPGQEYFRAMCAAANFAFANRQVLAHNIRRSFDQVLKGRVRRYDLHQVYDIAHNMAKVEEHRTDGHSLQVCVHRKGATRAFGPQSAVLPQDLRDLGQPVLIPGSMGTESFILVGTPGSMEQSFGSTCHGAGRVMSRAKAKRTIGGAELRQQLESRGIVVRAGSMSGLAEEAPFAYKDVSRVVEVVVRAGLSRKVACLEPIAVIKG